MDPEKIEPGRYYSVRQLAAMNVLPWRSAYTVARALKEEKWRDIFQPVIDQKKNAVRMHVKGESILRFLKMVEKGELSQ